MDAFRSGDSAMYLSLNTIFRGRLFQVPDYQRGYAWRRRQVDDLLEDIEELRSSGLIHYTGTVVAAWNDEEQRYDVVDGQQRLTTLLLILARIWLSDKERFEWIRSQFLQYGEGPNAAPRLRPNDHFGYHFQQRVIHNSPHLTPVYQSHRNIDLAVQRVDGWLDPGLLEDTATIITERLHFIFFAPETSKEIGIMFEVINNRGKPLSQLEKIKNYFIYFATIHEQENLRVSINTAWANLLENLNHAGVHDIDEEDQFLRYAYVVFFGAAKDKSWEVYESLKDVLPASDHTRTEGNAKAISRFVDFLVYAAQYYAYLRNSHYAAHKIEGNDSEPLLRLLKYLRCHYVLASVMPLYLAVMTADDLSPGNRIELLSLLERVNFRVYVLPKVTSRADSRQAHLFSLASQFYKSEISFVDLRSQLIGFVTEMCTVATFVEHLTVDEGEDEDYYEWQGMKYFLGRYEEYLQRTVNKAEWDIEKVLQKRDFSNSGSYLSLEHIWARKNRVGDFPESAMQKRRLGNFVLMEFGKNVQLSDSDPDDKIEQLDTISQTPPHTKLEQVRELSQKYKGQVLSHKNVIEYQRRSKGYYETFATILNDFRETDLVKFALQAWWVPGDDPELFDRVDSVSEQDKVAKYILTRRK